MHKSKFEFSKLGMPMLLAVLVLTLSLIAELGLEVWFVEPADN